MKIGSNTRLIRYLSVMYSLGLSRKIIGTLTVKLLHDVRFHHDSFAGHPCRLSYQVYECRALMQAKENEHEDDVQPPDRFLEGLLLLKPTWRKPGISEIFHTLV